MSDSFNVVRLTSERRERADRRRALATEYRLEAAVAHIPADVRPAVVQAVAKALKQERPDALICIDYPGFNLRFAEEVKKLGIPMLYYIVPQVWAWKAMRAKKMARIVDRAFCVFDFDS